MKLRDVLWFAVLVVPLLAGDLTITYTTKGKGPMGAQLDGEEIHCYNSRYQLVRNPKTQVDTLVDYRDLVTYTIHHKDRKVEKMSLEDALAILDAMKERSSGLEGMGALMGGLFGGKPKDTLKVEQKGTEVVAGRTCTRWDLQILGIEAQTSHDPTLMPPISAVNYAKMKRMQAAFMAAVGPMAKAWTAYYEELSKIKGIPLKTHLKTSGMLSMDSTQIATKIVEGPIPANTFQWPSGYAMEDIGKKLRKDLGAP